MIARKTRHCLECGERFPEGGEPGGPWIDVSPQAVRAARLLVAIETLALECRQLLEQRCAAQRTESSVSPAGRLDAALVRLQALTPRVEALVAEKIV